MKPTPRLLLLGLLTGLALRGQAQWVTTTVALKAGWNAIFLHVDPSYTTIDELVGNSSPIQEIWRWNPPPVAQFTSSPALPNTSVEWTRWNRTTTNNSLQRLTANTAYLVRTSRNGNPYTWSFKGRPVAPRHDWSISGLNLIGFSTVPGAPPNFTDFLSQSAEFIKVTPEIYHYSGGDLDNNNPSLISSVEQQAEKVNRGEAFWVRSGNVFNRYFGPFEVVQSGAAEFRETSSASTLRLRNLTSINLTVTLKLMASETVPSGQTAIAGVPPLLLRGSLLDPTTLSYGSTELKTGTTRTWTLAPRNLPGSEVEVVLGVDRSASAHLPGTLLAGILRFTDSLRYSQVDLPVSATVASSAGLWVGTATINQVSQHLPVYVRQNQTNYVEAPNGERTISSIVTNQVTRDDTGRYQTNGLDTAPAPVSRPYTGRLIIHSPTNGNAVLLQRVYHGFDNATNIVVATAESLLNPRFLRNARRISSAFLPWSETNPGWPMNGRLKATPLLVATNVVVLFDDQSRNPFLHTYHPDHDNLDATFSRQQDQGVESYTIERVITLGAQTPAADFSSKIAAGDTITGEYREAITLKGLRTNERNYQVNGVYTLNRVSPVPVLTQTR